MSEQSTVEQLKRCPFCGNDKVVLDDGSIICKWCGSFKSKAFLVKSWNHRPLEESLQAKIDDLERILQKERGNLGWIIMLLEDNVAPDKIIKMLEAQLDRINNQSTSPPDNIIDEEEL